MSCRPLGINASSNSLHTRRHLTALSNNSTSLQKPNNKKKISISQTWTDSTLMVEDIREVEVIREAEHTREAEAMRKAEVIRDLEATQGAGVV
jgi:hypothetical protein